MAIAKTVEVYECDGCGRMMPTNSKGEKPTGFYGKVMERHPDGNSSPVDFYAHLDRCIKNAVVNVLGLN